VPEARRKPDPLKQLAGKIGGHKSWANTANPSARTAPGRAAFEQKFLDQAGGDPVRARHLRDAFYADLTLKSVQARRRAKKAARGGGPRE
jgi:hypothetical protein